MRSAPLRISVKWESDRDIPSGVFAMHNREYRIERTDDIPDLQIFDATEWDTFDQSMNKFVMFNCPNLVICNNQQASKWLNFLSEFDAICLEENLDSLLPHKILRVYLRNKERKSLLNNSRIDQMTGLLNRLEFKRQLELELESITEENPLSALFMDMDYFKKLNDTYGHQVGDFALQEVSKIIRNAISFTPRAFRFGGEEFVILIRMNETQAMALAEYIKKEIESHLFKFNDVEFKTTISIGLYTCFSSQMGEKCLERADMALYQAKGLGRNQVVSYKNYSEELVLEGNDPEIKNFENRIKVLTERLTSTLTTKSKQLMSQIKTEADIDGLTGLFVRKYFDNRIAREFEISQSRKRNLSLIFIDVDHFGMVNKTYGFPTGDEALRVVSHQITESIRNVDWAARYGGEELCIILPDTTEEEAYEIANRIWANIGKQNLRAFDGRNFHITASLGVAQLNEKDRDLNSFIQRTSDRTRRAKESGRNQICREDRGAEDVRV